MAILLVAASTVAMANQTGLTSPPAAALCYCECVHQAGQKPCTSMCDLPQYESRWWANSCRKKGASAVPEEPESHHDRTNHAERAAL